MLKVLEFQNFKAWEQARVEFGQITGLFGTNSSGKTSILQFLLMLKQTKDATDRATSLELNGDVVSLGTFSEALHRHETDRSVEWNLGFKLNERLSVMDVAQFPSSIISNSSSLNIKSSNSYWNGAPKSTELSYRLGESKFSLKEGKSGFEVSHITTDSNISNFEFKRNGGRERDLPGPIKSYAFPDEVRTNFQNASFLSDLETAYEKEMNNIFYLGPLRQHPERTYIWNRSRPTDVGQRGEKTIDSILAATRDKETRNLKQNARHMSFQEMISHLLREMELLHSFKVTEIKTGSNLWQVHVQTRKKSTKVLLPDVGFGVSQVLPVITLLQYVPECATVILEQPELHLHPLAQSALADVMIQAAFHRNVQIVFESHSEHLLLRLQRRIAEDEIKSDSVRLYFCDAQNGESTITELEMDPYGNILNWPDKFMGDAFGDVALAQIKELERKREGRIK